jgi:hypothetical protein
VVGLRPSLPTYEVQRAFAKKTLRPTLYPISQSFASNQSLTFGSWGALVALSHRAAHSIGDLGSIMVRISNLVTSITHIVDYSTWKEKRFIDCVIYI